ncbi:BTAD domain-containing putative transcriptional regulator [Streptomyces caniscabiei]|uniref:AfsR/SARP family transcriptional regulator n=1 Tax=Streptomyces caniscabiei TaxID=2746961 RepID=UPI0029A22297|nr:BTAD domain-containing putative transcriptional regulator [Streptomyces caniscabiei]MDX2600532.1 BTAD domain-containing putative transcriptional regulator [Streptomyces caniscabiei]MDX2736887.1 BTAD domain-containing putative transcriptional regulator [Streptomyces caniscabiei]MDX2782634.1 BTAD domain-containing putative transcriptional regulator [Streptomyces caniscabiei]
MSLEYRLLGPVEVWTGGRRIPLGGPKPRALLAALLLRPGRVVSAGALIDTVWGDEPPDSARALVQTYVSGLRRALPAGAEGIETRPPGYLLRVDGDRDRLDLRDFERLTAAGRDRAATGDHPGASELLGQALELWRGSALGGVGRALRVEAERLEEARQAALEDRISADLASPGREQHLVAELTALVGTHPTRERLRGHLMLTLYRLGRQADALAAYAEGRAVLADELGIDPGPGLRGLHEAILRSDPGLMPPAAPAQGRPHRTGRAPRPARPDGEDPTGRPRSAGGPDSARHPESADRDGPASLDRPGPAQGTDGSHLPDPALRADGSHLPDPALRADGSLTHSASEGPVGEAGLPVGPAPARSGPLVRAALLPPAIGDFTGRERQLDDVSALLTGPREAMPVAVVSGPGGVGKSAFAVQVAHRVAADYPDGQLYAELHGFSDPVPPAEVLARLLRALGTEPPEGPAERGDLFRSLLARRRVLLVLDDAGSEAQVRPLLPGSASCGVLITSRARLAGLDGAARTGLDVLDDELGCELLARIAGSDHVRSDTDAARRIVALCGGLPLALRIAGARLATRRHWTPRMLADRLADERRRLDELTVGDLEVRTGLGLSYDALDPLGRTALRRLGLLGAPDVAAWTVAALLDLPDTEDAENVVDRLIDAQLLHFTGVDRAGQSRFGLHDLVRVYAAERAEAEEPRAERAAALGRALGAWLWLTARATAAGPSGEVVLQDPSTLWPVGERAAEQVLADPAAWFASEAGAIAAAVERAAAMDLHALAREAAVTLCSSAYIVNNRFDSWSRTHEAALAAVRRAEDRAGEALLLIGLGQLRYEQDDFTESVDHYRQAVRLCAELGDTRGHAAALAGLGGTYREQGRLRDSARELSRAIDDFRRLDDTAGLGLACRLAGSVHLELGEYSAARALVDESLAAYHRLGSRRGEALALRTYGLLHRALGEYEAAEELSGRALAILQRFGDRLMSAYAAQARAKARLRLGRTREAAADLAGLLDVCRAYGDRWGEALVRRTLGECALAEGRSTEAEAHLTEAVALWDILRLPLPRARTLRSLAELRDRLGDEKEADALREEAAVVFTAYEVHEAREPFREGPSTGPARTSRRPEGKL